MPVAKRPNGSWIITFYRDDGSRFRKTLPGALTKREVEAVETRYRGAERAKPAVQRRGAAVADLFDRYWTEHGQHLASHTSEQAYLNSWAARLGDDTPAAAVAADQIAAAVAHWRVTPETPTGRKKARLVSASTINHRIGCLQRVWRRACDLWSWDLAKVPWRRLKLDEAEPLDRSVAEDALTIYLAKLADRSRPIILFALLTGLRRGALLRLTVADMDWQRQIIKAVSKGRAGGKPTPAPMTEAIFAVLTLMGRLPEVGCIFTITKAKLRRDHLKARKAAKLSEFRFHDLRHQFAQRLEDSGFGYRITDALHHSDPRLAKRYSHVRMQDLGRDLDKVQSGR